MVFLSIIKLSNIAPKIKILLKDEWKSVKSLINQEFSNLLDSLLSCLLNPKTSVPVGLTSEGNNFEELVESSGLLKKVK